ncbi:ethanolaminephosphotransferase 1 isoform X1 [Neodiprion pinetum]|uniref:Ethanolaminephosphotransferase 1 isoform X1 n=1 Tax=Neodiprion lecontei TaxID=441921 RepID=A0A6J0C2G2_NEOLC|nr:ethanolaminephosphotransferase 1 isoform X1 [Neodiprion lecontei]XP_046471407.1 ethanolaminephosphotransferase 1-like isoform X1 [Neodiprion pinetum]XP_046609191.1 ethanolaminephosphotransferase 1-like isoform X1 [Neodiprion virginianus]
MKLEVDYLTQEHLMGFENYKYSSLDTSPLSIYVMHPFWNKVVEYCPKWVAPNLLTFTGFLFTVVNFLMFASYDYYYYASSDNIPEYPNIPRWVYAMAAFNIFMAYTLDGIDGKQARRTQTSGPLGELFDHGLDSWTAMLITVCMYSVFGRTDHSVAPLRMYFILWNVFINFYLSHWEKYNTGVLFLPWGYDASMLATIIVFVLTTFAGHEAWKFELPGGISAGIMFEILLYVSALVSNLPMVVWNIYKSYRDKTGKMRSFPEAVRPLVPATIFFTIATFWVIYSPNNIMEKDPRMIYFAIGTIFSNICCRLIVSQMSNTRCEIFPWILIPVAGAVACSFMVPSIELEIMYLVSIFALVAHIHYGTCVVRQMCHHFRIYTFHIREHSE